AGHDLNLHQLLMVGAIVVHDDQQRNAMMRGGPENPWSKHQVAIILNANGEAAVLAICKCSANRGRCAISHAIAALGTDIVVMLVEVPESLRPTADELAIGNERPVLILN